LDARRHGAQEKQLALHIEFDRQHVVDFVNGLAPLDEHSVQFLRGFER